MGRHDDTDDDNGCNDDGSDAINDDHYHCHRSLNCHNQRSYNHS